MRFLRKTAGHTLRDRKRNKAIQSELNVTLVIRKVQKYRRKWREHLERMSEERSPKWAAKYTLTGIKEDREGSYRIRPHLLS